MFRKTGIITGKTEKSITVALLNLKICRHRSGIFCALKNNPEIKIPLNKDSTLSLNDKVTLYTSSKSIVLLSLLMFLTPSVLFIAVLYLTPGSNVQKLLFAFLSIAVYFIAGKFTFMRLLNTACLKIEKNG